jgi:hypothetical protein
VKYSKLTATYNFIQKLSGYYPDNEYKQIFENSLYNTPQYLNLIAQLDTLNLQESLPFQGYPYGQKQPFQTISLIEKNLINSNTINDFISRTFGILPNDQIFAFAHILSAFEPIYQELIYLPNKADFDNKVEELALYVESVNLSQYFDMGLTFYGTVWDSSVPIDIAIIPTLGKEGFTATAFFNNAVSEVPLSFKQNDILFCVLMHEIYHLLYDGQSLKLKQEIEKWVNDNLSKNSQYAYLLLDEALATALGNGYVFEGFNKETDKDDWYNVKYINLMAQKIYPLVKEYIKNKKTIDQNFIEQYIKIYDDNFSDWPNELDHILTYRYILSENRDDFKYFRKKYRYASKSVYHTEINETNLESLKHSPITKVIIVSDNHSKKLELIRNKFPELKEWKYSAENEFIYTSLLNDKTKIIVVNNTKGNFEKLFDDTFDNKRIK